LKKKKKSINDGHKTKEEEKKTRRRESDFLARSVLSLSPTLFCVESSLARLSTFFVSRARDREGKKEKQREQCRRVLLFLSSFCRHRFDVKA
jgi:hypothetical protein